MSNYTKTTNFATKDNLSPGNPLKIVKGTEIDTEYNNIATAVATKTDNSAAAITGGTIVGITDLAVADGGTGASTAANARSNLSAAASGANSDITSLTGLTTPLTIAQGGTTASTAAGARTSLGLVIGTDVLAPNGSAASLTSFPTLNQNTTGNAATVTTNANLTGGVTSVGNAATVVTNANLTGAVTSSGNATSLGSFTSAQLLGALTDETGTGSAVFATSPVLVTPNLGTPSAAVLTSATGLPLSSGVTGTLPVVNGGTGTATPSIVAGTNITVTGSWPNQTVAASGGSGTVTSVALSGGTTGLTVSGSPITTSGTITVAGTLAVANGGTGDTSYTNGQLLIGNTTGNTLTKTTLTAGTGVTITNGTGSITIAASGGSGDVVGPASATDNAITRFDLTTGKLIQNSLVTVADDGAITAPQVGSVIPFYYANQAAFPSASTYHGALAHSHSDGAMFFAHGGVWVRIIDNGGPLGTPSSGTATNLTGLPLTTGVTGTLLIANGGTGTTSTTFANLTTNVTGTLPVANGGTGLSSTPSNGQLDIGNSTGFTRATITAGSGISVTNGSGSITIASTASVSAATPTDLGTVYAKQTTSGGTPFLTAFGYNAAVGTTGVYCTAVGTFALQSNSTGTYNTTTGAYSMYGNTTGSNNTASGYYAMVSNETGSRNTAIGYEALYGSTTEDDITAIGYQALRNNTTGDSSVAVGSYALTANTTGVANVAIGHQALQANTTGFGNTCVGNRGSSSSTTASKITSLGYNCLTDNTSGKGNVAIGYLALNGNTTGSGNTVLNPIDSANNYNPVFATTTENNRFIMGSTGVTNAYIQVAWTVVSDARDKTDFAPVPHGLEFVNQLQPTAYRYKQTREATEGHGPIRYGFKAQDVLALEGSNPVIVDAEDSEKLRFNDQSMIAVLVKALQELNAKFDAYVATHP